MSAALIDHYAPLLNSADAKQRKQAIIALGRSKDPAALRPLAQVYQNDLDEDLRQLALKAGQYLKQQTAETPRVEAAPVEVTPDAPTLPSRPVSAADVRTSRLLAEDALTFSTQGNLEAATKCLAKARAMNPALDHDTYFISIAAAVLNADERDAIAALCDDTRTKAISQAAEDAKKLEAIKAHLTETRRMSWLSVSLDVALYTLLAIVGSVLLILILSQSLETWRATMTATGETADQTLQDASTITRSLTFGQVILFALVCGVSALMSLAVQTTAIHLAATIFLRGRGTMRYLMHKLVSLYNRAIVTAFVIACFGIWIAIANGIMIVLLIAGALLGVFALFTFVKMGDRIGEAYHFGKGGGCLSVFIASIVLILANGAAGYLVYLLLSPVLKDILPAL